MFPFSVAVALASRRAGNSPETKEQSERTSKRDRCYFTFVSIVAAKRAVLVHREAYHSHKRLTLVNNENVNLHIDCMLYQFKEYALQRVLL
jgi:hypothetical protein